MKEGGTIDVAGFRADLASVATNDYPRLQLLRLPMNLASGVIYNVPLTTAGNNLVLTYEALDENGNYLQSVPAAGSLNPGIATVLARGFLRVNGRGPWLPISMFSALMQGMATVNANYTGCPITGGGYSSIQMPMGQLEWQVDPAFVSAGFMLAFFGINFGMRSGIGNGNGSTYAIPSSAGPVARLAAERRCNGKRQTG
jgi:hypothetical protein